MTLSSDRADLRARWYREGFFSRESIVEHFRSGVESFPDTTMNFVGGPRPASIRLDELYRRSRALAGGLTALGVVPGDVVAIWVPNWLEGAVTYQASLMIGATVVPIVHIYGAREVGFILRQSGARVLVMPDRWRNIDYHERFDAITELPDLTDLVVIGETRRAGAVPWDRLAQHAAPAVLPATHPDDVCLLIYTSGTTADPKGVQHTTNTLVAEIRSTAAALGERGGVNLAAFPAGHIAGVLGLLRMFLLGVSSVVMDRWEAGLGARLIEEHGVTTSVGAPFFLDSLLDEAERNNIDISSLGSYMVGAASVPPLLVERAHAAGVPVYRAYGSSEHPVISTGTPADPIGKRTTTDGRLTPGNEIRLLDDAERDLGIGGEGEIVSRGPEQFIGYRDADLDRDAFLRGGWFRTGDIGRLDGDGFLTITDRKKDLIIRGGENIASKEIEDILATHPAVAEVAAVAQPDPRYGERVAVFVTLRSGASLDLAGIRRHFEAAQVARQKTPEHLVIVDDFPRSLSGKVRKVELRGRLRSTP